MAYYSNDSEDPYNDIEDLYEDDGWEDEDEVEDYREWEYYYPKLVDDIADD